MSESYPKPEMAGDPGRLLSVEDVARILGMSTAWVYQHSCGARRPALPSVKLGRAVRFRLESVQEFIRQMERAA
jgi:predicted DNA-binding transcriptional regulator AlpA